MASWCLGWIPRLLLRIVNVQYHRLYKIDLSGNRNGYIYPKILLKLKVIGSAKYVSEGNCTTARIKVNKTLKPLSPVCLLARFKTLFPATEPKSHLTVCCHGISIQG